ncbi:transmembrane protein 255B isoform X3 [Camelus bactrianus]|uniref:Transmembrane protein 255B isoform X3 n=1 Tax=Camelus bactrianus TaxID=9837 RepID=A0AC58RJK1_CAMBA
MRHPLRTKMKRAFLPTELYPARVFPSLVFDLRENREGAGRPGEGKGAEPGRERRWEAGRLTRTEGAALRAADPRGHRALHRRRCAEGEAARRHRPQEQSPPRGSSPPGMQPLRPPVPGPLALLDATARPPRLLPSSVRGLSFADVQTKPDEARSQAGGKQEAGRLITEGFERRKKTCLWFVGSLLVVSTFILTIGLAATTRTENVTVGGYYPGIILGFGAFLGIIGINLVENRRQMEPRPLAAGRCQFYSSGVGYLHDVYQTEVTCHSLSGRCQLRVRSNTCYCCDLYSCESTEHPPLYYEFVGVSSCRDVLHLYRLLWASAALNVLGLFLGIVTAAVLGAFKDVVPLSQRACGPPAPPQMLYNPAQQVLAYSGFCPAPAALPTCSSFPLPLQVSAGGPGGPGKQAPVGAADRPYSSHPANPLKAELRLCMVAPGLGCTALPTPSTQKPLGPMNQAW